MCARIMRSLTQMNQVREQKTADPSHTNSPSAKTPNNDEAVRGSVAPGVSVVLTWNFQMTLFGSAGLWWCTRGLSSFAREHSQHCGPSLLSEKKKMHGAHFPSLSRKQGNSQTKRFKHGAWTAFPSVGIGDFRCRLHLQCLPVPRELPRQTSSAKR